MPHRHLLAVTEEIYDAATGGTPWHVVGTRLKAMAKARSISLMAGDVLGGQPEILCHAEIPEEAAISYRRHYRHVDLWTNRAAAVFARNAASAMPRVLASGEMLVPDDEFLRSEFYCDFGRRYGLRYVVGTVVPLGEAGAMPIGLHRPEGAERFGDAEKRLVEAVLPHLRRALQLRHRLAAAGSPGQAPAPGLAALDALSLGVLVLDADLHVLIANAAVEAMAREPVTALRLLRVSTRGGASRTMAVASNLPDGSKLLALVRGTAIGGGDGGALRLRDADGSAVLAALVLPLPRRLMNDGGGGIARVEGRALVLLRPLRASTAPRLEVLRDLFGLTRTEAEVARALAGGATKVAVASARGLRETTVRTHVRALLEKTGAANLRELERLLASLDGL